MGRVLRGGRVIPAERARALADGETLLASARRDAEALLESARAEAARIREEARSAGKAEALSEAAAMLVAANTERQELLAGVQQDAVTLAMEVARKLLRQELDQRPEVVAEICADALRQLVLARAVVLTVHPDDLAAVQERETSLAGVLAEEASLRLECDAAVERGGCVVESDMGRIDARLETQLAAIERALTTEDG